MLILPRDMLIIPIGDTLCCSMHIYLSPLIESIVRVVAVPFHSLHPSAQFVI